MNHDQSWFEMADKRKVPLNTASWVPLFTEVRYRSKRVAVAFGVLVALTSGAGCQQQSEPTPQTKQTTPQTEQKTIPTPYRIAEIKEQRKINQCLIQVVVPDGSTRQQIQQWHKEIKQAHGHRASYLFVNYYRGAVDADRMIATDEGDGELMLFGDF